MRPPDGGRVYYWCTATDETAWDPPTVDGPTIEPTAEDSNSNVELSAPEVSEPDTIIAGSETEDDLNNNPFAALDLNSNVVETAMGGAAMTAEAGALQGRGNALLAQFPVRKPTPTSFRFGRFAHETQDAQGRYSLDRSHMSAKVFGQTLTANCFFPFDILHMGLEMRKIFS